MFICDAEDDFGDEFNPDSLFFGLGTPGATPKHPSKHGELDKLREKAEDALSEIKGPVRGETIEEILRDIENRTIL